MAAVYIVVYLVSYGGPILGSIILFFALRWVLKRFVPFSGWLALIVVVVASNVPWGLSQLDARRDLAALQRYDISPSSSALEMGALWHLEEQNHQGITCGYGCDFNRLSFVRGSAETSVEQGLNLGVSGEPIERHDLFVGLRDSGIETPSAGQDFPFKYTYISLSAYRDYGVPQESPYRHGDWPGTVKGVHMLVAIPADGILDFGAADIIFRRYNIQHEVALPFLWGCVTNAIQSPSSAEIFTELVGLME